MQAMKLWNRRAALLVALGAFGVLNSSAFAQGGKPAGKPGPAAKAGPTAVVETNRGTIVFRLYPEEAPKSVANFITLAKKGFYNGLKFHRVESWVVQGGDPKGDGSGGPGYTIPDEKNKTLKHNRGAVGMAKSSAPNSAGSQFYFIVKAPAPHLDGGYTVFGQIISGLKIAESIQIGDVMKKVTIKP